MPEPIAQATPTPQATPAAEPVSLLETVPAEPKKWAGKYNTPEDLEKGYVEQSKLVHSRAPAIPDQYEFREAFKSAGYEYQFDDNNPEHKEVLSKSTAELREAGVTTDQLPKLLKLHQTNVQSASKAAVGQLAKEFGYESPDRLVEHLNGLRTAISAERTKLEQAWGEQTNERLTVLKQHATNLPKAVVHALSQTAEGTQWLYDRINEKTGPVPLRSDIPDISDPRKLNDEIRGLMASPEYMKSTHPDNKAFVKRVQGLIEQRNLKRSK